MFDRTLEYPHPSGEREAGVSALYPVTVRLFEIDKLVSKLARLVSRDPDVTPAVAAMTRELQQKSKRALRLVGLADAERAREAAIDFELAIERAEALVSAGPDAIRIVVRDMLARINGVTEDLLGNDTD